MAPFGFMFAERSIVGLLGATRAVGRLIPQLCGLAALALFLPLAQKVASRQGGALIGLSLLVLSDDLIFYSSELKQYSLDVLVAMVLSLGTLQSLARPESRRIAWWMAFAAIAAPWVSFPSVFIVAACGLSLVLDSFLSHRMRDAAFWCAIGAVWAGSFVAAYNASLGVLSPNTSMYVFWDFAFLPVWPMPMTVERTYRTIGILLEVFVSPLNMVQPPWGGVLLPLFTFLIGAYSLAAAIVARFGRLHGADPAGDHRFGDPPLPVSRPLDSRARSCVVYLYRPGRGSAGRRDIRSIGKLGYTVLLILLLGYPCLLGVNQVVFRIPRDFSPHGDLRRTIFIRYWEPPGRWSRRY